MVDNINTKVFEKLNNKINYYKKNLSNDLVNNLLENGRNKLLNEYSSNLAIQNINVGTLMKNKTTGQIFAKGNQVAFEEFGTGKVGEKSGYPDELLPKKKITFESPEGYLQYTKGWVYFYENKYTKIKYKGKWGWRYKGQFTRGMPAGKQVYNTSKYLRNNMSDIARKTIKGKFND